MEIDFPAEFGNLPKTNLPMNVPAFACTPDLFPEMMAAAIQKRDLRQWASSREIVVSAGK